MSKLYLCRNFFLTDWRHKCLKNTIDLLLFYGDHFYGFSESEIYVCIMRKWTKLLNFYLLFSGISSSPNVTTNWFCLLFLKLQRFAAMIHSVAINSSLAKTSNGIVFYTLLSPFLVWFITLPKQSFTKMKGIPTNSLI